MDSNKIISIENLSISFKTTAGIVNAIRGVDLEVKRGETVAIVGESGSGKSVTTKAVMGILAKNATVNSGKIIYNSSSSFSTESTGTETHYTQYDILNMPIKEMRRTINGKKIAMVFQDPMTSLDPTMNIGKTMIEAMILHYHPPNDDA